MFALAGFFVPLVIVLFLFIVASVFPMPRDIVKPFLDILDRKAAALPKSNGLKVPTL